MTPLARASLRRGLLLVAAALVVASCARRTTQISQAQFEAIQRQIAAQASEAATAAQEETATGEPLGKPVPPRNDGERRERVQRALPQGVQLASLAPVGDGTRWTMALATPNGARPGSPPHLLLFDVSTTEGLLLGEHDFGDGIGDAGQAPSRLGRTLVVEAASEEPVVLVELLPPGDASDAQVGACGWWLRRRRAAFLCAPRLTPTSRYDVRRGQLVETWSVDGVGGRAAGDAGRTSGRVLRFVDGQWQESDSFRCLGKPLQEAFHEAGLRTLAEWQLDSARRLTRAATRAADALDTDLALSRLRDALAIDGCAPETWRVLGRLEYEAGRPDAAQTLAVAVALAPRDDAVLVDLADAVAGLDPANPAQRDAWHGVLGVLGDRPSTRAWVEGSGGSSPRALAATLYRVYLERTSTSDEWLAARRRKVEEKLAALESGRGRR